jgi:hypothetical protein
LEILIKSNWLYGLGGRIDCLVASNIAIRIYSVWLMSCDAPTSDIDVGALVLGYYAHVIVSLVSERSTKSTCTSIKSYIFELLCICLTAVGPVGLSATICTARICMHQLESVLFVWLIYNHCLTTIYKYM